MFGMYKSVIRVYRVIPGRGREGGEEARRGEEGLSNWVKAKYVFCRLVTRIDLLTR